MLNNFSSSKLVKDNYVLRKTKSFNKSRYSRNRQYYRTGVFMCLWANIILVLGSYYLFFRLTLKFSYLIVFLLSLFSLVMVSYFSRNLIVGLFTFLGKSLKAYSVSIILSIISFLLKTKLQVRSYSVNYLLSFPYLLKMRASAKIDKLNRNYGRFEID